MKISFYLIIAAFFLGGCSQTIPLSKYEKLKEEHRKCLAYLQLMDLEGDLILLQGLRQGDLDEVIKHLESGLDVEIYSLKEYYFDKIDLDFNEKSVEALKRVKTYRQKYPRNIGQQVDSSFDEGTNLHRTFLKEMMEATEGEKDPQEVLERANQRAAMAAERILRELE